MTDRLHHPGVVSAMTREDVRPGTRYITYIPGQRVVEAGTFTGVPEYDGDSDDRWTAPATVRMGTDAVSKTVYLHDAGITPDETGDRWSDNVTVIDDSEEFEA